MTRQYIFFSIFFIIGAILVSGCQSNSNQKIKLAAFSETGLGNNPTTLSVLQVSPDQQRSIIIRYFKNQTVDKSLDWLRRGLTDMLITELGQSPYLNVLTMPRQKENIRLKENPENTTVRLSAESTMEETLAEISISGRFYQNEKELCIEVELTDTKSGNKLPGQTVCGSGLEQIFTMVDDLSDQLRTYLRSELDEGSYTDRNLNELTESIEAFKCYSEALENIEKFLYVDAEKCFNDAVKADSTFAESYLRLAQMNLNFGKHEEYKAAIGKVQKYKSKLSQLGRLQLQLLESRQNGNYQEYMSILRGAVNNFPLDVDIRLQLARLYRSLGNLDLALEEFEIALELDPRRKLIFNDLGYLYAERGDFTSAIKYLDKYQALAPNEPNPFDSKGENLMRAGRLHEAAAQFQKALKKWPKFSNSINRMTELSTEFGNLSDALAYWKLAFNNAESDRAKQYLKLKKAMILWRFQKNTESFAIIDQLLQENPISFRTICIAEEMYRSLDDSITINRVNISALDHFKKNLDKGNPKYLENLIPFCLENSQLASDAIPLLEQSLSLTKNAELKTSLQFTLALCYQRSGNHQKAHLLFQNNVNDLMELLTIKQKRGWGSGWKYVFESLDYYTDIDPVEHPFNKILCSIAHDAGREDLEVIARFSYARYYGKNGNTESLAKEYKELGSPLESSWRVLGPFSMGNHSGFEYPFIFPKETDIQASYQSGDRQLKWRPATDGYFDGYVNLESLLNPSLWSVGYGWIYVFSPEKRQVQIRLGSDETCKLWLNDELIWQHYLKRDASLDRDLVSVVLHEGYNKLLIKVTNTDLDWGFYLRVTDEKGRGFEDITFSTPEEVEADFLL